MGEFNETEGKEKPTWKCSLGKSLSFPLCNALEWRKGEHHQCVQSQGGVLWTVVALFF